PRVVAARQELGQSVSLHPAAGPRTEALRPHWGAIHSPVGVPIRRTALEWWPRAARPPIRSHLRPAASIPAIPIREASARPLELPSPEATLLQADPERSTALPTTPRATTTTRPPMHA